MHVPLTTLDFLDRAETVYGARTAVIDEPAPPGGGIGTITYAELATQARSVACAFDDLALGRGERVAILSPNAGRFLACLFGIPAHGRVLVPINYRLNRDEIAYIIEHSGASALLVDPEYDGLTEDISTRHRFVLGADTDADLFGRTGRPRFTADDETATATINYTSGTTARPKGVQMTHRNLWLNAVAFGWHMGINDRDTYLHTLPTFHCNGWGLPFAVAGMGATQVVIRKIDGEDILDRINAHDVTFLAGAPAVVTAALDAAVHRAGRGESIPGRDTVRMVVAGAPPPSRIIERVEAELGWEFMQIYGLTETSPLLTVNRAPAEYDGLEPADRARRLSRAGVPAIGVRMSIDGQGEILARSNHVFDGYWEQPEATAEAIVDGWFHTGDGGEQDDAYIVISDRKKDVIISGGENVSSIEVEDCLFQHPAVAEVAVIGVPDAKWGETVKALVVLRPGHADVDEAAARSRTAATTSRTTSVRRRSISATSWPALRPASSKSSSSARPTGKATRSR